MPSASTPAWCSSTGPKLAALMIEHDCGVVEESFVLKQGDKNLFEEP
jgi:hypothetical protein